MIKARAQLGSEGKEITELGYRLNPEAFYFKLCEEISFTPLSNNLIRGMYLPLDYWEILTAAPESRGERVDSCLALIMLVGTLRTLSSLIWFNVVGLAQRGRARP